MEIKYTLYTKTHCPNCEITKSILKAKKIEFTLVDDMVKVKEKAVEMNMFTAPLLSSVTSEGEMVYSGEDAIEFAKAI